MPTITIETGVPSALAKGVVYVLVRVDDTTALLHAEDVANVTLWHYIAHDGTPKTAILQHTAVCDAFGVKDLPNWKVRTA